MSGVSGSSNLYSFRDGRQVAVQLASRGVLSPGNKNSKIWVVTDKLQGGGRRKKKKKYIYRVWIKYWKHLEISNKFILICLLIADLPWNPTLCSSLLTVFEETEFPTWLLSSAIIFGAVFLWSFRTIRVKVRQSLSDRFRFLPWFWLEEEVLPSFSNPVITFQTVPLATPNNSAVFIYTNASQTSTNNLSPSKNLKDLPF